MIQSIFQQKSHHGQKMSKKNVIRHVALWFGGAACLYVTGASAVPCSNVYSGVKSSPLTLIASNECRCIDENNSTISGYLRIYNRYVNAGIVECQENEVHSTCGTVITTPLELKLQSHTTHYFKNTTEDNEYFSCSTDAYGEFTSIKVGLKRCSDGTYQEACKIDLSQWKYGRFITLDQETPSDNFQIKVTIDDHSNMAHDGSDLLFYDANDNPADYWIESWDSLSTSTVWVEVPSQGSTKLAMYYGNANATASSNGDNTFIAFDDFNGSTIDSGKWDKRGTVTVSNGSADIGANDGQIISKTSFSPSDGVIIETKLASNIIYSAGSRTSLNGASSLSGAGTQFTVDEPVNSQFVAWSNGRDYKYGVHVISDGDAQTSSVYNNSADNYEIIHLGSGSGTWLADGSVLGTAFEDGRVEFFLNNVSEGSFTNNTPTADLYPLLNTVKEGFQVDRFWMRKFKSGYNPIVTVGIALSTNGKPLSVEIVGFDGQFDAQTQANILTWKVLSSHVGFNVFRAEVQDGEYVNIMKLNSTLYSNQGHSDEYTFIDDAIVTGKTYYYGLESFELNGTSTKHLDDIVSITTR